MYTYCTKCKVSLTIGGKCLGLPGFSLISLMSNTALFLSNILLFCLDSTSIYIPNILHTGLILCPSKIYANNAVYSLYISDLELEMNTEMVRLADNKLDEE